MSERDSSEIVKDIKQECLMIQEYITSFVNPGYWDCAKMGC
jgi:hypothetical protein